MKHKHADLMAAYAADAQTTDKPWELWEYRRPCFDSWHGLFTNPEWERACEYRRKPMPKTNLQVARELLDTALDNLEEHSVEICEPNVDHIQNLIRDVKELLQEPEGVAVTPPPVNAAPSRRVFSCTVQREIAAFSPEEASWHLREIVASGATEVVVADKSGVVTWEMGVRPKGV